MVKSESFRVFCLTVGFIGMILMIVSDGTKLTRGIGITLSVILMLFGVLVTSKFKDRIIGEETPEDYKGAFGGASEHTFKSTDEYLK